MTENAIKAGAPARARGELTIVGVGIAALAHLTRETDDYIRGADVVFYHATTGIMAAHIRALNPNAIDLYRLYGEGKRRSKTYVQMTEVMLREVRKGKLVTAVFHGHPSILVLATRRAVTLARAEGYPARVLPGISSVDCLLADLGIDPGVKGLQMLNADTLLAGNTTLAPQGNVVFFQVGAVGDSKFSWTGYKQSRRYEFVQRLIAEYGPSQEVVHYFAAIFPGLDPRVTVYRLSDFATEEGAQKLRDGVLYIPPRGMTLLSILEHQAFRGKDPYNEPAQQAIQELDTHAVPEGFRHRYSSPALVDAMAEIATSAELHRLYRRDPIAFAARHPGLSEDERVALISRDAERLRKVTTLRNAEQVPAEILDTMGMRARTPQPDASTA